MQRKAPPIVVLLAALLSACGDSNPSAPVAGPPANLLIQTGGATQTGTFGQPTPVAPSVLVTDASNRPVPGASVTFAIVSGGGSLSSSTVASGPTGVASVTWTLGNTFGPNVLRASTGSLTAVTFNATAIAPDAGILAFNQADPAADTLAYSGPTQPKAIDLVSTRGDFKRDSLILTLTFAEPVSPASVSASNSVYGFVELDIDDNAATGEAPASNAFGATANLGIEYILDLFAGTTTSIGLASQTGFIPVPASYAGNTITARIAMSHLGNDDGNFSVVSVFGTSDRPTDFAPNTGGIAVRRSLSAGAALVTAPLARSSRLSPAPKSWGASVFFPAP